LLLLASDAHGLSGGLAGGLFVCLGAYVRVCGVSSAF
jgi:hypothetical protein